MVSNFIEEAATTGAAGGPLAIAVAAAAITLIALTQHPFGIGNAHLYADNMTGGPQKLFNDSLAHVVDVQQYDKTIALSALNDSWTAFQQAANQFGAQGAKQRNVAIQAITSYTESRDVDFPSFWSNLDSVFKGITVAMPALGLYPSQTFTSGTGSGAGDDSGKKAEVPLVPLREAGILTAIEKFLQSIFSHFTPTTNTADNGVTTGSAFENWIWLILLALIILALFLFTRD